MTHDLLARRVFFSILDRGHDRARAMRVDKNGDDLISATELVVPGW